IEAASRTIWPPEQKKFEEMIQRVVFTKLSSGQLDESGLTIEDLRIMTSRMASTLVNMYHGRIKYPWQREQERAAVAASAASAASAAPPTPPTRRLAKVETEEARVEKSAKASANASDGEKQAADRDVNGD